MKNKIDKCKKKTHEIGNTIDNRGAFNSRKRSFEGRLGNKDKSECQCENESK